MQNVQPKVELKVERSAATILTDAKILAIRPPEKGQVEVRDKSVPGLRIRVGASGSRTFVLRKTVAGRNRNITLGRYCERFGLAEARKKARQLLSDIELKADPLVSLPAPRRRIHVTPTISSLWPEYKAAKAHLRKIKEVERVFMRHIIPAFGDRAADKITRGEITRFIDGYASTTPVMARNVLAYFSAFYSWALPRLDDLPGNP
jgi:hypothetical protein